MNIVHILIGKANPNSMNGVNKVVHNLATIQSSMGHNVEVWGITTTPSQINHKHDYPLRLFQAKKNKFSIHQSLKQAIQNLEKDTKVHLHSVFLPELYSVSKLLKSNSLSWVLTPHGGYMKQSLEKNNLLKRIYFKFFEKFTNLNASKIHAIGKDEVVDIVNLTQHKNIILIPNGQDLDVKNFNKIKLSNTHSSPIFGFCGRLAISHKGLDLLMHGFFLYKKCGGDGELWIIGDGPDKAILKKIVAELELTESVIFFGTLFGDEKLSHIDAMDVFVHTSRWDVIPTSVLEASVLSKPLLISKETNLGDYVRKFECGVVLDENKPEKISEGLLHLSNLYKENRLSKLGENSYRMINEELNWNSITKQIVNELYN